MLFHVADVARVDEDGEEAADEVALLPIGGAELGLEVVAGRARVVVGADTGGDGGEKGAQERVRKIRHVAKGALAAFDGRLEAGGVGFFAGHELAVARDAKAAREFRAFRFRGP